MTPDRKHRLAEERSLAYHRVIAQRVRRDPSLVEHALGRVHEWSEQGLLAEPYTRAWLEILEAPIERLCESIVADDEDARALRQTTPFVDVLDPRERWKIWTEVGEQFDR